MWTWRTAGVLGTLTGTALFHPDRQVVYAKSSSDASNDDINSDLNSAINQPSHADFSQSSRPSPSGPDVNKLKLRNVQVFFRHGARSPLRILNYLDQPEWPKDEILGDPAFPAVDYKLTGIRGQAVPGGTYEQAYQKIIFKGGTPAGQLTKIGKDQVHSLGRRIRQNYIENRHFLSGSFKKSEVYVRSTNMLRTIESARWLLSGIYGDNRSGDSITIYTEPDDREILYPNHSACLHLKTFNMKLFKAIDDIPGLRENRLKLQKLLNYNEDTNNKKKLNYIDIRDEIIARQAHGISVPESTLAAMNEIELYAVKMLTFMVSGSHRKLRKDILRLACGPVLHLIHDNMEATVWNDDFYKLQLFSCHDSMLMALLVAMGIFNGNWPPFAADLTFETYLDEAGKWWVRVLYMNEPQILAGAEHGDLISLEKFSALIGPYAMTIASYQTECEVSKEDLEEGEARSAGL